MSYSYDANVNFYSELSKIIADSIKKNTMDRKVLVCLANMYVTTEEQKKYDIGALLIIACYLSSDLEIIKCLVEDLNADVNFLSKNKTTPIMYALQRGDSMHHVVQYLVKNKNIDLSDHVKIICYTYSAYNLKISENLELMTSLIKNDVPLQSCDKIVASSHDAEITNYKDQITVLKGEIASQTKEITGLKLVIANKEFVISRLTNQYQKFIEQSNISTLQFNESTKKFQESTDQFQESTSRHQELACQYQELSKQYQESHKQYQELSKKCANITADNKKLVAETNRFILENNKLVSENNKLVSENNELISQNKEAVIVLSE
jgi:hypothetical protein